MPQYDTVDQAVSEYSTTDNDQALQIVSSAYAPVRVRRAVDGPVRCAASFRRDGPLALERVSHSAAMQIEVEPLLDSVLVAHRLGGALDLAARSDPDNAARDGPVLYAPSEGMF